MRTAALPIANNDRDILAQPLAARIAQAALAQTPDELSAQVIEKVKICLFDLIGCAFESRDLPWSAQAKQLLQPVSQHLEVVRVSKIP